MEYDSLRYIKVYSTGVSALSQGVSVASFEC